MVAGIDTDAGKTVASAILCLGLKADYWKPVQAGLVPTTDTLTVAELTGLPAERFLPEAYRLEWPASPHAAAAREGVRIEAEQIVVPATERPLIIEGAGGLMVPLRDDFLYLDLMAQWKIPVILVVRTYLGSINHSLLSIEVLKARGIPLAGIIFNDGGRPESESVILSHSGVPCIGQIPVLERTDPGTLQAVWDSWEGNGLLQETAVGF